MTGEPVSDPGVQRFQAFAASAGINYELVDASTHTLTVSQAAEALGVDESQVIKTLLFHDSEGQYVIAIANGTNRIDAGLLALEAGLGPLKLAKPRIVTERLGYPAGGVPPIGLPFDIPVFIDYSAAELEWCVGGAGSTTHLARLAMEDIQRVTNATVAAIVSVSAMKDGPLTSS